MITDNYPLEFIRDQFPALQKIEKDYFVGYFDGPGGSQVAKSVIEAMVTYMKNGVSNLGGSYPTALETVFLVDEARDHVATLLGTDKKNISFGANMTSLAFKISRALSESWDSSSGNIVITEMDHHANIDPWVTAAQRKGLDIHTLQVNPETKTLDLSRMNELINEKTKLVAIGLASNAIGTINNYSAIIERAKEVGALIAVDAVHAVPHFTVNFNELGADFMFCSAYKFFGPHVGIVAVSERAYNNLNVFKLRPAPDNPPNMLETGTLNFEGLVGVSEAIRFIASIGEGNLLSEQLTSAYSKMNEYENYLADHLRSHLADFDHITLYQADNTVSKTPTVAFQVKGMEPKLVCHHLAQDYGLHLEYGNFYAQTLIEKLNVKHQALVRAGIAPYNTVEEINRLIQAVKDLKQKLKF
ncbi:cysteine desulfurase-like protein [Pseudogracilibacillus sp. SE30717A]|uniref:cysteine desulfurase-like protein n=1 Tax=Pseudogracilibacillus sp. SE30717A TaxID=3098293 RepID=UPI00300E3205